MSFLGNDDNELRARIGGRLKVFRESVMKRTQTSFADFAARVNIPIRRIKNIEAGRLFPDTDDMVNLRLNFGLNINWLFGNRGNVFCFVSGDNEEKFETLSVQTFSKVEVNET